jgi:hypothetical protein
MAKRVDPEILTIKFPSGLVYRAKVQAAINRTTVQQIAIDAVEKAVLDLEDKSQSLPKFLTDVTEQAKGKGWVIVGNEKTKRSNNPKKGS